MPFKKVKLSDNQGCCNHLVEELQKRGIGTPRDAKSNPALKDGDEEVACQLGKGNQSVEVKEDKKLKSSLRPMTELWTNLLPQNDEEQPEEEEGGEQLARCCCAVAHRSRALSHELALTRKNSAMSKLDTSRSDWCRRRHD